MHTLKHFLNTNTFGCICWGRLTCFAGIDKSGNFCFQRFNFWYRYEFWWMSLNVKIKTILCNVVTVKT